MPTKPITNKEQSRHDRHLRLGAERRELEEQLDELRARCMDVAGQIARDYRDGATHHILLTWSGGNVRVTDKSSSNLSDEGILRAAARRQGRVGAALLTVRADRAALHWSHASTDPNDWWLHFAVLSYDGDLSWITSDDSLHDHLRLDDHA